jgi:hypothetical protein
VAVLARELVVSGHACTAAGWERRDAGSRGACTRARWSLGTKGIKEQAQSGRWWDPEFGVEKRSRGEKEGWARSTDG